MKKLTAVLPHDYRRLFTIDDMNAIRAFHNDEEDTILSDAFSMINTAFGGNPLNVYAEFCRNRRAGEALGSRALDVWLMIFIHDAYRNRVVEARVYLTDVWSATDSNDLVRIIRDQGILHEYNG